MKEQITVGVGYILKLINRHKNLDKEKVEKFGEKLTAILSEKYIDHWYPENPLKGQAYRCIRINRKQHVDESLLQACDASGLTYSELPLPKEMSLWIDPSEVSCRLGENSNYFTVAPEEAWEENGKRSPAELETSDYHSEGSDYLCESSSEDESAPKKEESTPKAPVLSMKQSRPMPVGVPDDMKEELSAGVDYLVTLANRHHQLNPQRLERFKDGLTVLLCQKYTGHWYPEHPSKGQAYRCIQISGLQPPEDSLLQACAYSGLAYHQLTLPEEMTLWIDPYEVCCRLGENTHYYTVANFEEKKRRARKPAEEKPNSETSDYYSDSSSDPASSASSSDDEGGKPAPQEAPPPLPIGKVARSPYGVTPLWVPNLRMAETHARLYHPVGYYQIGFPPVGGDQPPK